VKGLVVPNNTNAIRQAIHSSALGMGYQLTEPQVEEIGQEFEEEKLAGTDLLLTSLPGGQADIYKTWERIRALGVLNQAKRPIDQRKLTLAGHPIHEYFVEAKDDQYAAYNYYDRILFNLDAFYDLAEDRVRSAPNSVPAF